MSRFPFPSKEIPPDYHTLTLALTLTGSDREGAGDRAGDAAPSGDGEIRGGRRGSHR